MREEKTWARKVRGNQAAAMIKCELQCHDWFMIGEPEQGAVLTNQRVVDRCSSIEIGAGEHKVAASLLAADVHNELAILRAEGMLPQ